MKNTLYIVKSRLHHFCYAHQRGGFGIHSPFIFHWLNSILYERTPYYKYKELRALRHTLRRDDTNVDLQGFGTSSARTTSIGAIVRTACARRKYSELLFRIANHTQAKTIVELGTNLGLTTLHLAFANKASNVYTLEGEPALYKFAQALFKQHKADNIHPILGNIDDTLPQLLTQLGTIDLLFFDANHTYQATINYAKQCLAHAGEQSIFIFDDIHHSPEMERAWNEIQAFDQVRVTLDTFQMGIVFFNKDLQKEHYLIAY